MNLPLNTDLTGKVAVVTGAAGTLCSVFSKALAASGAKVALLGRTYANVQKLADEITAEGGTAKAYECNVLDKAAVMACHEQVLADFGPCDILINGAGGNHPSATTDKEYYEPGDLDAETKSFFDLDEAGVASVFNLNFMGILIPTQAFARDMVAREGCNIINISSMNAYTPLTKIPAYSGAKSAVSNFTQWLAVHFSKVGIRVNAIAPGFFSGKQNAALLWNPDGTPTARTKKILAATPMGRFGQAEELLGALLFLLNDEAASFVTGVVIPVDGGFSAYSGVWHGGYLQNCRKRRHFRRGIKRSASAISCWKNAQKGAHPPAGFHAVPLAGGQDHKHLLSAIDRYGRAGRYHACPRHTRTSLQRAVGDHVQGHSV